MRQKTFNEEMQEMFGGKVYRLSLSTGCTCPNRDGTVSTGGCIFCSAGGSGEFSQSGCLPVSDQIELAKQLVEKKISKNCAGYMAYFQSFTNTYGPCEKLRELFQEALSHPEIRALSVATRPDCLPDDIVSMLSELNREKPVYVELGLQTMHEDTAVLLNRGYPLSVFEDAFRRLNKAGLRVVVHLIIGLPGEDEKKILETAAYLAGGAGSAHAVPDGIKLQILQVLKGTRLSEMEEKDPGILPSYSLPEYAELVRKILSVLPETVTVHRLTGDPPKKLLISPLWTADKKRVLNTLTAVLSGKEESRAPERNKL